MPQPDVGEDEDQDDEASEADGVPSTTTAQLLRGEGLPQRAEHASQIGYVVLPWNAETVRVFRQCQPTILAGLGSAAWLGFSAVEIRAALALERVPMARRDVVIAGVRVMERAAREVHSDAAKEKQGSAAK